MENLRPISMLVRNERGVLARVASLFARRGFNITSLAVGETENPQLSRISVVVEGDDSTVEKAVKQLRRLVCVIRVEDFSHSPRVERGLALIKVRVDNKSRAQVVDLVNIFRARVDHVGPDCLVVEVAGDRGKVQAMTDMLRPFGILEMARTGQISLTRAHTLHGENKLMRIVPSADEEPAVYNKYLAPKEAENGR